MKKTTYDLTQVQMISDNDPDFINTMVDTFLKEMPLDLENLASAVLEENRENVRLYAHKMKPSLELFGLKGHERAHNLEDWGKNTEQKDINEDFMFLHQELESTFLELERDF